MHLTPLFDGNPDAVTMIGFDFGSTTSSAMVAEASVGLNAVTGRMEFGPPRALFRSEPVFTPFNGKEIDSFQLNRHIAQWLGESGIVYKDVFAGGVIITGLAAKRSNADAIARMVGARFGEALIATADDPRLESWMAFMGNCSVLSRFHAQTPFINLDIGGGTTNAAYGINGNVLATGCHFIGARHFQFEPGDYRLVDISSPGRSLLAKLGINKSIGERLTSPETEAILQFCVAALEAITTGDSGFFNRPDCSVYQQVPFIFDPAGSAPVVVFSGGVGELVYRFSRGEKMPGITHYGDLGIDLAVQIAQSPILSTHIDTLVPENQGRATVYGLTLHSTEISGSTIFLSAPRVLPCRDLPIVARLPMDANPEVIHQAILLAAKSPAGACIQVLSGENDGGEKAAAPGAESLEKIKMLGIRLYDACLCVRPEQPVVVLAPGNYGQTLGNYATGWRQSPVDFIVIDEIPDRRAHFVNIGRLRNNFVPVSFYGIG